ncbi:MAG: hypothetical protein IPJ32_01250 [Sphingobacteriaceae bacterium]|nr:hypothetical protein [Sphingobacteriaceae bacterium]
MRKVIFIVCWLTCFSCGQSNSEFGMLGFSKPEAPHIGKVTPAKYKDVAFRLDTLFTKMVGCNGFNGAVIVAKDAEVIYQKCFGYADKKK